MSEKRRRDIQRQRPRQADRGETVAGNWKRDDKDREGEREVYKDDQRYRHREAQKGTVTEAGS